MQPSNICLFNSNVPWGGGEKWHYETALHARDHGYRVSVIAHSRGELAKRLKDEPGIRLHTLPMGSLGFLNPLMLSRIAAIYRQDGIEAVILCLPRDMKAGGLAARLAGVPQIIYRRGIAVAVKNRWLNRFFYGRVITKLIVNSEETLRCVLAENPQLIERARAHRLPCDLDCAAFDASRGEPLVARRPGELLIGNAGRLTHQKGQSLLIEAAAIMRGRLDNFRVLIAGVGELEAELKEQVKRLDLQDVVEFLGFRTEMRRFHDTLDIFALPSLWEGFGIAQMEAMCAGRPVVAFNVSSIPEVVVHGETGLLSEPSAQALAENLLALAQDADKRRAMGQAGRQRVLEHFDTPRVFARFEEILRA